MASIQRAEMLCWASLNPGLLPVNSPSATVGDLLKSDRTLFRWDLVKLLKNRDWPHLRLSTYNSNFWSDSIWSDSPHYLTEYHHSLFHVSFIYIQYILHALIFMNLHIGVCCQCWSLLLRCMAGRHASLKLVDLRRIIVITSGAGRGCGDCGPGNQPVMLFFFFMICV